MNLTINGEIKTINAGTLADVLYSLGYKGNYFAVALNMTHVPSSKYDSTNVTSGDAIEILMPMQGG